MRKVICAFTIVLFLTSCMTAQRRPSFWDRFGPLPCCPELPVMEPIELQDILVVVNSETVLYQRGPDAAWVRLREEDLTSKMHDKQVLLTVKRDSLRDLLFAPIVPVIQSSRYSILCKTPGGYGALHLKTTMPAIRTGMPSVGKDVIIEWGEGEKAKDLQKTMRFWAERVTAEHSPDDIIVYFSIREGPNKKTPWNISGMEVAREALFRELREFERWRKEKKLPHTACWFAPRKDATVQEVLDAVVSLYKLGIKRVEVMYGIDPDLPY